MNTDQVDKEYLTTKEVAQKFSLSLGTLEVWRTQTKKGQEKGPKWTNFHGSIRYHVKDLDVWKSQQNH